jgi:hypothetical protein
VPWTERGSPREGSARSWLRRAVAAGPERDGSVDLRGNSLGREVAETQGADGRRAEARSRVVHKWNGTVGERSRRAAFLAGRVVPGQPERSPGPHRGSALVVEAKIRKALDSGANFCFAGLHGTGLRPTLCCVVTRRVSWKCGPFRFYLRIGLSFRALASNTSTLDLAGHAPHSEFASIHGQFRSALQKCSRVDLWRARTEGGEFPAGALSIRTAGS